MSISPFQVFQAPLVHAFIIHRTSISYGHLVTSPMRMPRVISINERICTMIRVPLLIAISLVVTAPLAAQETKLPKPFVTGLKNPESVAVGNDGRIYISEIGEFGKDGDGRIMVVGKDGKAVELAKGLGDPKGIGFGGVFFANQLFGTDNKRVVRVDPKGQVHVVADEKAFPTEPLFLNDICVDEHGVIYVSDSGIKGSGGAIYRIQIIPGNPKAKDDNAKKGKTLIKTLTSAEKNPLIKTPNGLVMDGKNHLLMLDFASGDLLRIRVTDGDTKKIAGGFDGGDGLAWDNFGRLFITSWKTGKVWGIARPGQKPVLIAEGFKSAADLCLDTTGRFLIVPDMKEGTLTKLPTTIPGWEVDDSPLPLNTEVAFPKLEWSGWQGITDKGKQFPLRPLLLTHAGDGSNRVFVGIQQGTIHVFPNDQAADKTKIFLNIENQVFYSVGEQ